VARGDTENVVDTEDLFDLDAYNATVRERHDRFSLDGVVHTHFAALGSALGVEPDARRPVYFCAIKPRRGDLQRIVRLLSRSYRVRTIFVWRDPRAQYYSTLGRYPDKPVEQFCRAQSGHWRAVEAYRSSGASLLRVRFESLLAHPEDGMREICSYAEIDFDPSVLRFTQAGTETSSNSSHVRSQGIDPATATRYRDELPASVAERIESLCPPELFATHG
jgi:hypothetical protein